jgi:hypothetical protein
MMRRLPNTLGIAVLIGTLVMSGCGESPDQAYRRGFDDGHDVSQARLEDAREEGHRAGLEEGYRTGYEAARPPSGVAPPIGAWRTVSMAATVFGLAKIVLSFVVFALILIVKSSSWFERSAKIISTSLSVIIIFWLSSSVTLGFSRPVADIMLAPGPTTAFGKIAVGVVAAVLMWAILWGMTRLISKSEGHLYLQLIYVMVSAAVVTILIPVFLWLKNAPNLFGYQVVDLTFGVVIGGVSWIVQRLAALAEMLKKRRLGTVLSNAQGSDLRPRRTLQG